MQSLHRGNPFLTHEQPFDIPALGAQSSGAMFQ
jgi:hypothetical protein